MSILKSKAWSPYAAGIVIGLLQAPALLVIDSPIGASSSYVSVAAYIAGVFDPDVSNIAYMDKYMTSMKYVWQGTMVLFIAVGAYLSMRLSGARRKSFSPAWTAAAGMDSLGRRSRMTFMGGFVMLFGARWAGGCTSGHGLSGVGQLAAGSIVVTLMFFVGGIAVSRLYNKL
jgi:uncharacterized membrane protein YedE/YeeE